MLLRYNKTLKYTLLFLIGGFAYGGIEILFRGYSHISMLAAGGICFILIGLINEIFSWDIAFLSQMVISSVIITVVEFIFGLVVNIWMGLNVWDYSNQPYNIMGQTCILFSIIWFFLSPLAILLDDYLRYYLLGEEKPRYKLF
ncbi:putative ABC transporter permease [Herbinix luporum]|jgi:uncharacterized membrane protein|uniref:putative ABC transporter permease n=1 Tax=Herbinix luporum TaxID=1679721 RepID=UPI0023F1AFF7|nr:hypothetical protein [Herbinix luporum]